MPKVTRNCPQCEEIAAGENVIATPPRRPPLNKPGRAKLIKIMKRGALGESWVAETTNRRASTVNRWLSPYHPQDIPLHALRLVTLEARNS